MIRALPTKRPSPTCRKAPCSNYRANTIEKENSEGPASSVAKYGRGGNTSCRQRRWCRKRNFLCCVEAPRVAARRPGARTSGFQPPLYQPTRHLTQRLRREGSPAFDLERAAHVDVAIDVVLHQLFPYEVRKGYRCDPAVTDVIEPLFVITVVRPVKVHDILTDEDEVADPVGDHIVDDIALEVHNVIVDRIVPLADQFDYRIAIGVVGEEYLNVECF